MASPKGANGNDDSSFQLHWDHIKSALSFQLYSKLPSSIEIEKLDIAPNDFSTEAVWTVLDAVSEKRKLCEEERVFIHKLVNNAISFDPITQCMYGRTLRVDCTQTDNENAFMTQPRSPRSRSTPIYLSPSRRTASYIGSAPTNTNSAIT